MAKQQMEFTATEAIAICDMIAQLLSEDYEVRIELRLARRHEDDSTYYPYKVEVIDTNDEVAAKGQSYLLIEALETAYVATPEGKAALDKS